MPVASLSRSGVVPGNCISINNKFPGNSDGDGAGITLWEPSMHVLMAKVNSPC